MSMLASTLGIGRTAQIGGLTSSFGGAGASGGGIGLGTLSVFSSALSGITGAFSQYQASRYNAKMMEYNKKIGELQAADALRRGEIEEGRYRQQVGAMIGQQRVSMAAQGLDVNDGSALQVQQDTARIGEIDAMTIRHNAAMEAWGYKVQAAGAGAQADMARKAGTQRALSTLSTGFLDTWVTGKTARLW